MNKFLLGVFLLLASSPALFAQGDTLGMRLKNFKYPYPVLYMRTQVQQKPVEIAYMYERPAKGNGKTVLLLHGKNFPAAYWGNTIKMLTNAGYTVLAPDALGFGKSSKPAIQYSFSLLALVTRQLLDTLHINDVYVIGHSTGGMLATRFALSYPERVNRLVLASPIGLEDWRARGVPYRNVDTWAAEERAITYEEVVAHHKQYYSNWNEVYRVWADVQFGGMQGPEETQAAVVSALQYDMIFTQPVVYEFKQLKVPVLLLAGEDDHTQISRGAPATVTKQLGNYRKLVKRTAKAIRGSQYFLYAHCGHVPFFEQEEKFNKDVLNFFE